MKTYLVKETQIGYKKVTAKSKKEAIEKATDVGLDEGFGAFGDCQYTAVESNGKVHVALTDITYQAYLLKQGE